MRQFSIVIEIFYWILIALCPILIGGILGALVYTYVYTSVILFFVFQGFGILLGGVAEYIRRKYGCSTFYAKLMNTPDLDNEKKRGRSNERFVNSPLCKEGCLVEVGC